EAQLILNAIKGRLKVIEIPSFERPRRAGASNLNAYRDGCRFLMTMLSEWRPRPTYARPTSSAIKLFPIHVSQADTQRNGSSGWERRRAERRRLRSVSSGYTGPERRRQGRRRSDRSVVYMAMEA